ncbi:response regulator receiver sensor signal transduction histidine kinase [Stanieria cyanosphaera PCC 7437]|uniref:Circadian input-output histidine kinase CikA n=1 Tax=Stanieria cyanosphaera (strain ATCC 29371 / PCC 7437) TaxID=111780 RepID=K9Y1D0_STAC7|nr:HAMP domain-containing sensor histidine kinase [Stanieria cyanosphaera]AFZ37782.1 response regulator receiver sensor signal transduction histidine kinase [Stanieria cyanosphaera PCC 7437]
MFNSSGLSLQLAPKLNSINNVNLLILTDEVTELEAIIKTLETAEISFTYEATNVEESYLYLDNQVYDAILYNYCSSENDFICESPLERIDWWLTNPIKIPLILITELLGDEIATQCIQSGVSGYVLKHKLHKLPRILEKALINFFHYQQQLEVKKQQEEYIKKLEQEKREWQIAEATKQEFISHLNHELRNPIAAILGFARMLKEEIYGSLNAKQMQYISGIASTGEHLLELVNDYLDLAKLEAQKEELFLENLAVEDICRASLAIVEDKARQKGIDLILNLDKKVDFCVADKLRLKQILVNLLSNAVKFTQEGSVTLQVQFHKNMLKFAVIDTGIGISPADCQKLFQPFQQIHTPLHRLHKGTGLGLALSQKLARLHGGDITLASEIGKGSCFTLSIPRLEKNQL